MQICRTDRVLGACQCGDAGGSDDVVSDASSTNDVEPREVGSPDVLDQDTPGVNDGGVSDASFVSDIV